MSLASVCHSYLSSVPGVCVFEKGCVDNVLCHGEKKTFRLCVCERVYVVQLKYDERKSFC